jgi:uncharacterized protein (UPF0335 family)
VNTKTSFAQGQLKSLVERIERLNAERDELSADVREVFAEAKANGFDTKILRKVIALRKLDTAEREEAEAMLDLYLGALGMQPDFFEQGEVAVTVHAAPAPSDTGVIDIEELVAATPAVVAEDPVAVDEPVSESSSEAEMYSSGVDEPEEDEGPGAGPMPAHLVRHPAAA